MRRVVAHTLVKKEGRIFSESPLYSASLIVDDACQSEGWRSVTRLHVPLGEERIGQGLWLAKRRASTDEAIAHHS